jgi:isopentenyl phosphate kinase
MITLLKLGGSVITDKSKPYTARMADIKRLAREVKEALDKDKSLRLIIGNGGGSYPHQPAKRGDLASGIKDAWQLEHLVETHRAAAELNHMIVTELVKAGVPAIAVKPSSAAYTNNREIASFNIMMIEELLKLKAVPVIHGDVLLDLKQGCSIVSTEKLFRYIAGLLPVGRAVIGTNVDGVLDDKNRVIEKITNSNFSEVKKHLKGAATTDVTGGMLHKVESMLEMSKVVPEIRIVNALKKGNIAAALEGKPIGTLITNG